MNYWIESTISENIKKYIEEVTKYYDVETIILFGSYVNGKNRSDSDIDIAIVFNELKDNIEEEELNLMRLRRKIDKRIEPHIIKKEDFEKVSTPFIKEIIDSGIKIA